MLPHILKNAGPFLLGLILGSALFVSQEYWLGDPETITRILVVFAAILLAILLLLWFAYRVVASKAVESPGPAFRQVWKELSENPILFADKKFWSSRLAPVLGQVAPTVVAWFAFSLSLTIVTLVLTNILLFATLLVQLLSADRLAAQNELLRAQNEFMQVQVRVDVKALLQQENERNRLYSARWSELEAFRFAPLNDSYRAALLHSECSSDVYPECERDVDIANLSHNLTLVVLQALAERKESYLTGLVDAAITDPPITSRSSISEILAAMRAASNDCFGKDEYTLGVIEDLRLVLSLEFAASAFLRSHTVNGVIAPEDRDNDGQLQRAFQNVLQRLLDVPSISHGDLPEAYASTITKLHGDILSVVRYCREATEESDATISELTAFLEATASRGEAGN